MPTGTNNAPWQPSASYALGDYVQASPDNGFVFECTAVVGDALTGSSAPSWNTATGATTADNHVTWTCVGAAQDYDQFQVGSVLLPLTVYPSAGGLLLDADPALFYFLDFAQHVIEATVGTRFAAELQSAGVVMPNGQFATKAVAGAYPFEPLPEQLENQFQFPFLAAWRKEILTEWLTVGWEHDITNLQVIYVLPPLNAAQATKIAPIFSPIAKALRKKMTDAFDDGYLPGTALGVPGPGSPGDQWTSKLYANLEEGGMGVYTTNRGPGSKLSHGAHGYLENANGLYFPCLSLEAYFVERDMYAPTRGGPAKFAGGDVTGNLRADDGTRVAPFFQVASQQAPTIVLLSVASGSQQGGTTVVLTGTNYLSGALVFLGPADDPQYATNVTFLSSTSISFTTPAVSGAGAVDVTVVNRDGQWGTLAQAFTYTAP